MLNLHKRKNKKIKIIIIRIIIISTLVMMLNNVTSSMTCWGWGGGGWSRDVDLTMRKLFGSRGYGVLRRMQKATISSSLNIVRTFKATAN